MFHAFLFIYSLLAVLFTVSNAQGVTELDINDPTNKDLHRSSNWGDNPRRTEAANATIWFTFTGTGVQVHLNAFVSYGYVGIDLDGNSTTVDTYLNASHVSKICALCTSSLPFGEHNVTLTNLGPSAGKTTGGYSWLMIQSLSFNGTAEPTSSTDSTASPSSSITYSSPIKTGTGVLVGSVVGLGVAAVIFTSATVCFILRRRRPAYPPPDSHPKSQSMARLSLDPSPVRSFPSIQFHDIQMCHVTTGPHAGRESRTACALPPRAPPSSFLAGTNTSVRPIDSASNAGVQVKLADLAELREMVEHIRVTRQPSRNGRLQIRNLSDNSSA